MVVNKDVLNYDTIEKAVRAKGYAWNDKAEQLNIVGIRNPNGRVNRFDDLIVVCWLDGMDEKKIKIMVATTVPGVSWLLKPMNAGGTAILAEGQYKDVYKLDLHRGEYTALCQRLGKVTIYRDADKDTELDFVKPESGYYGINIHRAHKFILADKINWYSAGCQVIANINDYNVFIELCKIHSDIYSNKFTYTLINENDILAITGR